MPTAPISLSATLPTYPLDAPDRTLKKSKMDGGSPSCGSRSAGVVMGSYSGLFPFSQLTEPIVFNWDQLLMLVKSWFWKVREPHAPHSPDSLGSGRLAAANRLSGDSSKIRDNKSRGLYHDPSLENISPKTCERFRPYSV